MSIATGPRRAETSSAEGRCLHCGAPLAPDQEWCLECGSARTVIHRPPDWRVPVAVIGIVVMLVLAGLAIALISLSQDENRNATTTTTAAATTPTTAATTTTATPATPRRAPTPQLASWPVGLSGWTVVVARVSTRASARAIATRVAQAGSPVGVLETRQHPNLTPGYWVVFSGRYPTPTAARTAAAALVARGQAGAHVALVGRPGQ